MKNNTPDTLTYFSPGLTDGIDLPQYFTFPFNYEPHPLTQIAAGELQRYLETQTQLNHNFGLAEGAEGTVTGKMFGVLVVKDKEGRLGYLSAFSGKLAGSNHHPGFVPPVFDMLSENSFFLKGIATINSINLQIKKIESVDNYKNLKQELEKSNALAIQEIAVLKQQLKINKANRKKRRNEDGGDLPEADLIKQSLYDKHLLNVLFNKWEQVLQAIRADMAKYETSLEALKSDRKERSAALQTQIFEQYEFLNINGERKSLRSIFNDTASGKPPSAAGECATPKLLQYAFLHGYRPLAMAEFWWGADTESGIRVHKQFYPACTERCKPILNHMLEGMTLEENPEKDSKDVR